MKIYNYLIQMKKLLLLLFITFSLGSFAQGNLSNNPAVLLAEAKDYSRQYSINNTQVTMRLDKILELDPDNATANYLRAQSHMEARGYANARKNIDKAIQANPANLEYRWVRVKALLVGSASAEDFALAARDLNFMANNGKAIGKVYANLVVAETELAHLLKGDENYTAALEHYSKAANAHKKYLEVNAAGDFNFGWKYNPQALEREREKVKQLLAQL